MKKIFHSRLNLIITALVLVFLVILIGCYVWAIDDIIFETHEALTYSPPQDMQGFDLSGAANLDLRGLVSGALSTPASAPTTTPTTTAASTATITTSSSAQGIAQQLSGFAQAIPDDNTSTVPVIFSNLHFISMAEPITIDVSAADENTAGALNDLLEQSSHFADVQVSAESVASSGRILYSITFVYRP